MIIKNPQFEISCVRKEQYPTSNLPEVVLVGKSNVGKSSFINTMINRKSLARTSSQPGKTRLLNFYNMDNLFYFVDLPGYGYSKMSKQEQEKVGKFTEEYLTKRSQIVLIVFLVDIRHTPTSNDILMYDYILRSNLPFIVLANKADKIAPTKVSLYVEALKKDFGISLSTIMPFSSEKKIYSETVWKEIEKHINQ